MTENQNEKFGEYDAENITNIIRRRQPHWNHKGIMGFLQQASQSGASLTQVMAAAEKTWNNAKAKTPAALLWPEHWTADKTSQAAGNIMAPRLCVECTAKRPVTEMTKHPHGWVCNTHEEEGTK
jgi:hypothetical protein